MKDQSLRDKLYDLQDRLIPSIESGTSALLAFQQEWEQLTASIFLLIRNKTISQDTTQLAHSVAEVIGIVTSAFIDLEDGAEKLCEAFKKSLIVDGVHSDEPGPSQLVTSPHAPYIEPAYFWLLENLHNPYPSTGIRNIIAKRTGCARKDIDNWFTDVRKRIGWTALRKSRFSNRRVDIVGAATRFFVTPDPQHPLDPVLELAFATIESCSKDLYSEKFTKSTLATRLDTVVNDMTQETQARAKTEGKQRRQSERRRRERRARDALSYPSPGPSPGSNEPPLPSSPDRSSNHLTAVDVYLRNGKRRGSSISDDNDDDERFLERRQKRIRLGSLPRCDPGAFSLPSPAASLLDVSEVLTPSPCIAMPPFVAVHAKRKRRLSEADGPHSPKRPNNARISRRPQAVSDPFPIPINAPSFDEWYQRTFIAEGSDIPGAVSVEQLDATTPLDIEIYNFPSCNDNDTSVVKNTSQAPLATPPSSTEIIARDIISEFNRNEDNENAFSWFDLTNGNLVETVANEQVTKLSSDGLMLAFDLDPIVTEMVELPKLVP